MLYFEWDPAKAVSNLRKHGISFEAASEALEDPYRILEEDCVVGGEERPRTIGMAGALAVLLVIHLDEIENGGSFVRIISARKATPQERRRYDETRAQSGRNTP